MRKEGLGAVLPGHWLRHLIYETAWLLGTGLPRKFNILTGREKLKFDPAILMEGFKHHTRYDGYIGRNRKYTGCFFNWYPP